jgi:hypothetical protein
MIKNSTVIVLYLFENFEKIFSLFIKIQFKIYKDTNLCFNLIQRDIIHF